MRLPQVVIVMVLLTSSNVVAFGPPNYLPNGAHPRIFLTSSVLSALKSKAAGKDADWLALKKSADSYVTKTVQSYPTTAYVDGTIYNQYEGYGWYIAIDTLAMAYKVSGNTAYAAKVKQIIDVINAAGNAPMQEDSGYPSRSLGYSFALAYDWLYDYLDSATKTAMITTMNGWYDWYSTAAGAYKVTDTSATSNYWGGHVLGYGLIALATYGDNARAGEIHTDIKKKWDTSAVPSFTSGALQGGYAIEGFNYGDQHFMRLLQYAQAVETATGQNITFDYPDKIATSLIYNLKPNRWQATDEGNFSGSFTGIMSLNLPLILASVGKGSTGDQMKYFLSDFADSPVSSANTSRQPFLFDKFLYSTSRIAENYKLSRPLYYKSPGDEHLYTRSDWTDNAVWVSFMAGITHFAPQSGKAAGHINIQRGSDYLLVSAGQWKGTTGIYGSPFNFRLESVAYNTLYFLDDNTYCKATDRSYEGCQGDIGTTKILNYETGAGYSYEKADLTSAYYASRYLTTPAKRTLTHFYRNFVSLGGGATVVVYDCTRSTSAAFTKRLHWYVNPQGTTVVDGTLVTTDLGSSRLHIKTVYPKDATTKVVTNPTSLGPIIYGKRVEVSGPVSTDFNPLTVMISSAKGVTTPKTELVLSSVGKMLGAYIKDPTNPNVVMFTNDSNGNNASENITYTLSNHQTGKRPWHTLVHLPANTEYTVIRPINDTVAQTFQLIRGSIPSLGAVHATSSQGVLRIAPEKY